MSVYRVYTNTIIQVFTKKRFNQKFKRKIFSEIQIFEILSFPNITKKKIQKLDKMFFILYF